MRQRPSGVGFFVRVTGGFCGSTPFGWVGGHGTEAIWLGRFAAKVVVRLGHIWQFSAGIVFYLNALRKPNTVVVLLVFLWLNLAGICTLYAG